MLYFSAADNPNTSVNFFFVVGSHQKSFRSPSIFITKVWSSLLEYYLDTLELQMGILFQHDKLRRYKRPNMNILSSKLSAVFLGVWKIMNKPSIKLVTKYIFQAFPSPLFVLSPLGLVSKDHVWYMKIHCFFFSVGFL